MSTSLHSIHDFIHQDSITEIMNSFQHGLVVKRLQLRGNKEEEVCVLCGGG